MTSVNINDLRLEALQLASRALEISTPKVNTTQQMKKVNTGTRNENYEIAQKQFIDSIIDTCSEYFDEIQSNIDHVVNYRKTINIDLSDDKILNFSKTKFFENKTFQYKLREELNKNLSSVWIRIFPSKFDSGYCIIFQKSTN